MNQRGILNDFPQQIIIVFVVAVLFLLVSLIFSTMNTPIQADPAFAGEGAEFFDDMSNRLPKNFDSAIGVLFFGLLLVVLGIAWLLATNGILFFIVWTVVMLVMSLGGFLANAWVDITSSSALSAIVTTMPITNFILSWYLVFVVAEGFLMLTIFFAKQQTEGGF